jgi:cysteine desulfurase
MEFHVNPKYFDYSAASPIYPAALKVFMDCSVKYFANPSSAHRLGIEAKQRLLELKKEFCDILGFKDGRLLLCSSGSEANNTIIEGHLKRYPKGKILVGEDVHDSIWYATMKYPDSTNVLPINSKGSIDMDAFNEKLTPDITLVCINQVCNEIGTIHGLKEIADICVNEKVKLLVDGAQAMGHLPLNLERIPFDYYTFSSNKFGGPKSVGGVLIRDNDFDPLISGGKQEWNLRAGSENLPGLAATVIALKKSIDTLETEKSRLSDLKELLLQHLRGLNREIKINSPELSLPGFISLSIPGFNGNEIVAALSLSGYSISTGSACHANEIEPSRIVMAMQENETEALGTIRISMGYGTTEEHVNYLAKAMKEYLTL